MSQRGMVHAAIAHRGRFTSLATDPPCPRDGWRSSVAHVPILNGTGEACSGLAPPRSRPGADCYRRAMSFPDAGVC